MQAAQVRREHELQYLVLKGVPLCTLGKSGHWMLGPLHIFTAAGRWFNEETGRRGRLNSDSMSRVVEREYFQQLCSKKSGACRGFESLYQKAR